MLLRGPRQVDTGRVLRASSIVGYVNGSDPGDSTQHNNVLRGLYPSGTPMIDSTTMLPTLFHAWGDPATGTGWLMPDRIDMKLVLGAGPFHFAPGDTQFVDAAIVVGQGTDRPGSVVALRANAREARAAFASGFATVPETPAALPPRVPLVGRPNPSLGAVLFDVRVPPGGARVELVILDLSGRSVRTVADGWRSGGDLHLAWDGATEGGRSAPAGVYFARAKVAEISSRTRVVLIR